MLSRLSFFIIIPCFVLSQTDTIRNKILSFQAGINVSQFIKQYLSLNSAFQSNLPYLINLNVEYRKLIGLRSGINIQTANSQSTIANGFDNLPGIRNHDKKENKLSQVDYRLGIYYHHDVNNNFYIMPGLDFTGNSTKSYLLEDEFTNTGSFGISNNITKINTKSQMFGGGGFLMLQYKPWKNIILATELCAYYQITKSSMNLEHKEDDYFFNGYTYTIVDTDLEKINENIKSTNTRILVPLNIFLYINF